jgi:hypothetical protein
MLMKGGRPISPLNMVRAGPVKRSGKHGGHENAMVDDEVDSG